jgi:solute carrier family 25 iron transporter 28/37
MATAVSDGVMNPFDVIKQRMQVNSTHRSIINCITSIYRQEGFSAFYISYPTTLLLNVPFHMIQFPVYESCSSFFNSRNPISHIISGGLAGGFAAFLTTPIDVIKTTLQTRNIFEFDKKLNGMSQAIRLIYNERGIRGFVRGAVPRSLTHIPGTAICWMVYEYFKEHLLQ